MTDPGTGNDPVSVPSSDDLEAGWQLAGADGKGRAVRLLFGETQLRRAYPGLTIGRHPALSDLVIDDPTVSRRHLRLGQEAEEIVIEDLNSLNGTVVGGAVLRPFEPIVLADGAELALGLVILRLARIHSP